MKRTEYNRLWLYIILSMAILLILAGGIMLGRTFTEYNKLSLERQDRQLIEAAKATDASMRIQLDAFRENLRYVIDRRPFILAESEWLRTGNEDDLLSRMQENLISQNPLIHAMLAIRDGTIALSTQGDLAYHFPSGMTGDISPCFGSDGAMYLALFENGRLARYAVLVRMTEWYEKLTSTYASDDTQLLLLGSQGRILLHTWQGQQRVSVIDELSEANCDMQALSYLLKSRTDGHALTATYHLSVARDDHVHEMRMTAIPPDEGTNGYFVVGLTSDYDEILVPMQRAAWAMFSSGVLLMLGFLLMVLLAMQLVHQTRLRDQELERLILRNEETQKLLDRTRELAHHQRLETIGTLTASIAHEFNNLLTPIMGYAILSLEALPEDCDDLADNIAEIYEASRKAKDIISRLNALTRKNTESQFTPLSLVSIAEKVMKVAAPAQPSRVSTRLINHAGECLVSGNETHLAQLMLNLILNAYHAMEASGGSLTLTIRTQKDAAVMEIRDEGVGIPEEALPHIFDPFYTTKETKGGTGLGLAIVQQVLENHHGSISVHSRPGHGSTFIMTLPLANSASAYNS